MTVCLNDRNGLVLVLQVGDGITEFSALGRLKVTAVRLGTGTRLALLPG